MRLVRLGECSRKTVRAILTHPKAKGKEDIKCTLRLTTEMGECQGCKNVQVPASGKEDIKCTYVPHWLTTEMGEC